MNVVRLRLLLAADVEIYRQLKLRRCRDVEVNGDASVSADARNVGLNVCFVGCAAVKPPVVLTSPLPS